MRVLERICEWVRNGMIITHVTHMAGRYRAGTPDWMPAGNEPIPARVPVPGPVRLQPSGHRDTDAVRDTAMSGPDGRSAGDDSVPGDGPVPDGFSRKKHDPWTVTVHAVSRFEKVGRIVRDHGDLVLRSDLDARGFFIAEEDVKKALAGGNGEVWLLDSPGQVGTVRLSVSGRALNMTIDGRLHTVPLRNLLPVIEGKRRKAALFKEV